MEELKITGTGTISDKLCMTMAKKCHKLQQLSLRGCHRVTAFSVVAFCEALMMAADSIPITVDLRGTSFDSMEVGSF
jgi:hypothetical protein